MRVAEEWWYVPALLVPCTCESLPGSDLESTSEVVGVSSLLGDHTRSVADPHIMVGDNFSICAHILSNLPRSRGIRRSVRSLWAPLFSTACGPAIYVHLIIQCVCKLSFLFLDTALLCTHTDLHCSINCEHWLLSSQKDQVHLSLKGITLNEFFLCKNSSVTWEIFLDAYNMHKVDVRCMDTFPSATHFAQDMKHTIRA